MKIKLLLPAILFFVSAFNSETDAQCGVKANASFTSINCGDSVTLLAYTTGNYALSNNFNSGNLGSWTSTKGGHVVANADPTYSCMDPSIEPPSYFFMSADYDTPRSLESTAADITQYTSLGATICWKMRYSSQGDYGTCEGPDASGEGIYLEYNTGGNWIELGYYDPRGGNDVQRINWNEYCVQIPAAAYSALTKFRWLQKKCSGIGFDTWAIDDVKFSRNQVGYKFDWLHDNLPAATLASTPKVSPKSNTVYTVTYSNKATGGTDSCSSTITVNVATPSSFISVDKNTICSNGTINLIGVSSYKAVPPQVCGPSANNICNSANSQSGEYTLPLGKLRNTLGNCNENIFGVSNCGGGLRSQIIYRASELLAMGMKPGKITYMMFEVDSIDKFSANKVIKNGIVYVSYANMQVKMGGTAKDKSPVDNYYPDANTVVYNSKTTDLTKGWNQFTFDQYYDWDGKSNLLINICYALPVGENLVYTKNAATSFLATSTEGTNGAGGSSFVCEENSPFVQGYKFRPNTKFGTCEAKDSVPLVYNWSPKGIFSDSSIYNPSAIINANTDINLNVSLSTDPTCAASSTIHITVDDLKLSVNPTDTILCPDQGQPVAILTAQGSSSAKYKGIVQFNSIKNNLPFPDNDVKGVNSSITLANIKPSTLNANSAIKVCLNLASTNVSDNKITLTSPNGNTIVLYDQTSGSGVNFSNTCFVAGGTAIATATSPFTGNFVPLNPLPTTGNVNGTWTLNAADIYKPFLSNAKGGTLSNWNISFIADTNLLQYSWINNTSGLSATNIQSPTVTPVVSTTYTAKVTDAIGCTATAESHVSYCNDKSLNDSCQNALEIIPVKSGKECTNLTYVNTSFATPSTIAPSCANNSADDDVWYKFIANNDKMVVKASNYSSGISGFGASLYSACNGAEDLSNCFANAKGDSIVFSNLVTGQEYYMNLFTTGNTAKGAFEICLYAKKDIALAISTLNALTESLTISPNPTDNLLNLNFNSSSKTISVKIMNVNGQQIFKEEINSPSNQYSKAIDMSAFAQGIYFLQINTDKETMVRKIVKQ